MSSCFRIDMRVGGFDKKRKSNILEELYDLELHWYEEDDPILADNGVLFSSGQTDEEIAADVAADIFRANGGPCEVAIRLQYVDAYDFCFDADNPPRPGEKLLRIGGVPYIEWPWDHDPSRCARCGKKDPEHFLVPDAEWERYVEIGERDKILCRECFGTIKRLIDEAAVKSSPLTEEQIQRKVAIRKGFFSIGACCGDAYVAELNELLEQEGEVGFRFCRIEGKGKKMKLAAKLLRTPAEQPMPEKSQVPKA